MGAEGHDHNRRYRSPSKLPEPLSQSFGWLLPVTGPAENEGELENNELSVFLPLALSLLDLRFGSSYLSFQKRTSPVCWPSHALKPFWGVQWLWPPLPLSALVVVLAVARLGNLASLVGFPEYFQQLCKQCFIRPVWTTHLRMPYVSYGDLGKYTSHTGRPVYSCYICAKKNIAFLILCLMIRTRGRGGAFGMGQTLPRLMKFRRRRNIIIVILHLVTLKILYRGLANIVTYIGKYSSFFLQHFFKL